MDISEFFESFKKYGYKEAGERIYGFGEDALFVRQSPINPDISHFVRFDFASRTRGYSVKAGVCSASAIEQLRLCWRVIRDYVHQNLGSEQWAIPNGPCWTFFEVGRWMKWNLLLIPDPIDKSISWNLQLEEMIERFMAPFMWSIHSGEQVISVLEKNSSPFEWVVTNSILRLSEIAATLYVVNYPARESLLSTLVERHRNVLARDANISVQQNPIWATVLFEELWQNFDKQDR